VKGLYPGYFIGQLLCTGQSTTSPEKLDFIVVYQELTVLTSDRLSVQIQSQLPTNATDSFFAYNGMTFELSDLSTITTLQFGLVDKF
jgi:hypothetical protein